jgi:hypothetical protein
VAKELDGAFLKVDRANQHIAEPDAKAAAYFSLKPYRIVVEEYACAKFPSKVVLRIDKMIPADFALIIGDAIHNLRSALDLMTCAFVRANGGSDHRVQFPLANKATLLDQSIKQGKVDLAAAPAVDFIKSLNPHREPGGNLAICAIHDLDIVDKHRLILTVGAIGRMNQVLVGLFDGPMHGMGALMPGYWLHNVEDGSKIMLTSPQCGVKVGNEINAAFYVTFGPGQPLERQPVLEALVSLSGYVRSVLEAGSGLL